MPKVIMMANQKGGVGKTTLTMELAGLYARRGNKVLVIDQDGQGNLSLYTKTKIKKTYDTSDTEPPVITDLLMLTKKSQTDPEGLTEPEMDMFDKAVQPTKEGFDVIASNSNTYNVDSAFGDATDSFLLKTMLDNIYDEYDYIFLDNAPARNKALYMSYYASDYVIIVCEADEGSINGVKQIAMDVKLLHQNNQSQVKILGMVLNKSEVTNEHAKIYQKLNLLGQKINAYPFESMIWKGIVASESKNNGQTIYSWSQHGKNQKKCQPILDSIEDFAKEIDERIEIYDKKGE